jgi:hypothetical protein
VVRGAFDEAAVGFEPRTVEAVSRVVFGDERVDVVAVDLAMTPNAVRVAKSRMLKRVRTILKDLGETVGSTPDPPDHHAESNHGGDTS